MSIKKIIGVLGVSAFALIASATGVQASIQAPSPAVTSNPSIVLIADHQEGHRKGAKGEAKKEEWRAKAKERYENLTPEEKERVDKRREQIRSMSEEERAAFREKMKERRATIKNELEGLEPEQRRERMKELREEFWQNMDAQ